MYHITSLTGYQNSVIPIIYHFANRMYVRCVCALSLGKDRECQPKLDFGCFFFFFFMFFTSDVRRTVRRTDRRSGPFSSEISDLQRNLQKNLKFKKFLFQNKID